MPFPSVKEGMMTVLFWTVAVALSLATIEMVCFSVAQLRPDLFDYRQVALAKLQSTEFERFKATSASDLLGWDNPTTVRRQQNCVGHEVTYSYDEARVRLHGQRRPQDAIVLVTGDSVTHGDDVADDDTYPAALERILGVPVANLGVGGYGPDQALLKLEALFARFPRARIAVLSILYDDTSRMVNSFRPVLFRDTGVHFGLKPFVRDGVFHPMLGGNPFRDLAAMRAAAEMAFDTDFWRRARPKFPYSVATAEMMSLPSFWLPLLNQLGKYFGKPHYEALHRTPSVRTNLRVIYERFANWTKARGLRGIIAFIPVNGDDQTSGLVAISAATEDQQKAITFMNVELSDLSQFARPDCHPTPEGYRIIADSVATVVRPLLADITAPSTVRHLGLDVTRKPVTRRNPD
jgi:hypothetical protein